MRLAQFHQIAMVDQTAQNRKTAAIHWLVIGVNMVNRNTRIRHRAVRHAGLGRHLRPRRFDCVACQDLN